MRNRVGIYLSSDDQHDLMIIAFLLADQGLDGLVSVKNSVDRSATVKKLISEKKSTCDPVKWSQIEQFVRMLEGTDASS